MTGRLLLSITVAAVALASPVPLALAATFTANSTADDPDGKHGDGLCLTAAGDCTLRAAVQETNALGAGPHTIVLLGGATYTLTRAGTGEDAAATGDLDISTNVTIDVTSGVAVVTGAGGWDDRIFHVRAGVSAQLRGLQIQRGRGDLGGGIYNAGTLLLVDSAVFFNGGDEGGGIFNDDKLTLLNSSVFDNGAVFEGGGIWSDGTMTLLGSFVFSNNAGGSGGGISDHGSLTLTGGAVSDNEAVTLGGGIFHNGAALTLRSSTVSGNSAASGGGIFNVAGGTLTSSTIRGNSGVEGGGIYATRALGSPPGALTLTTSTISGNSAANAGGGIYVTQESGSPPTTLTLTNSTISGNSTKGDGGGIWNLGTVTANNVTIADNKADSNANGTGDGGGVFNPSGGTVSIANTIVGRNVDESSTFQFPDCLGSLTSRGHNLIQKPTTACSIGGDTTGNIAGRDPLLGPLQDNGGSTFTHALVQAIKLGFTIQSPAIDAGSPGVATACPSRDQRGFDRPLDGNADGVPRCDIGAYEAPAAKIPLGTFALAPTETSVHPGGHVIYTLRWTVPAPRGWRSLRTLELAFLDDEETALWMRFEEVTGAPGLLRLVNPKNGNAGPAFAPGSPNRLESELATVYLAESAVDGPPGQRVTLTLAVSFKPHAAGRVYDVLVGATDDAGEVQGFHRAGTVAVQSRRA